MWIQQLPVPLFPLRDAAVQFPCDACENPLNGAIEVVEDGPSGAHCIGVVCSWSVRKLACKHSQSTKVVLDFRPQPPGKHLFGLQSSTPRSSTTRVRAGVADSIGLRSSAKLVSLRIRRYGEEPPWVDARRDEINVRAMCERESGVECGADANDSFRPAGMQKPGNAPGIRHGVATIAGLEVRRSQVLEQVGAFHALQITRYSSRPHGHCPVQRHLQLSPLRALGARWKAERLPPEGPRERGFACQLNQ